MGMAPAQQKVVINFSGLFLPLLTLLFVGLKLTGYISWSWWWVTAPLWGPFAFSVGIVIAGLILALIAILIGAAITKIWGDK